MDPAKQNEMIVSITLKVAEDLKKALIVAIESETEKLRQVRIEMNKTNMLDKFLPLERAEKEHLKNIADSEALYRQLTYEIPLYKREQGIATCMICSKPHDRPGHTFCSVQCQGDFFKNKK